jgi:transposase
MRARHHALRIFLFAAYLRVCSAAHTRKQRSGLAVLAQEVIQADPFSGALFLFVGRRYDRIKMLWWDRNGFVVWYKVIEGKERFAWPRRAESTSITISAEQLQWLLEGYDVWKMKPHRSLHFSHVC